MQGLAVVGGLDTRGLDRGVWSGRRRASDRLDGCHVFGAGVIGLVALGPLVQGLAVVGGGVACWQHFRGFLSNVRGDGRAGEISQQGFDGADAVGHAERDRFSGELHAASAKPSQHGVDTDVAIGGNVFDKDLCQPVDQHLNLGAAAVGGDVCALVRRLAADDLDLAVGLARANGDDGADTADHGGFGHDD